MPFFPSAVPKEIPDQAGEHASPDGGGWGQLRKLTSHGGNLSRSSLEGKVTLPTTGVAFFVDYRTTLGGGMANRRGN